MAAGTGGVQGQAVSRCFEEHPDGIAPKDVAQLVGCTVAQVNETVRAHGGIMKDAETGLYRLPDAKPAGRR